MVASIAMWSMRASQDEINVYEAYGDMLMVTFAYFDCIDIDEFSVHELNDMVKKISFSGKNIMYYRCHRLKKSGENEVDLMGRAWVMYQDESRNSPFNHEKALAILRQHAKWDAPEVAPVKLTEDETSDFHATVNTDELFGADPRPRPLGKQLPEKNQIQHIDKHRGKSIVPIRFKTDEKNSGSQKVVLLSYGNVGFFGCECEYEKADVAAQNLVLPSYGTLGSKGMSPINASPVSKMKPRRPVLGIYAKKLLLGWKQNDANVIGESSYRLEDGESSQPNTANPTTQTDFSNDFYSLSNLYLEVEDFDPFFGLDSEPVDATIARNECVGKGKRVGLDDDQIHVEANKTIENETADRNSDEDTSESSEHDEFVDTNNQLVDVEVDMDHFDTANAKTMGNDGTPEFNANDVFDIGIDVIDTEEFESTCDEDGIERIRSRKMKQLKKHNNFKEGGLQKTRRELYLKKNDKVKVRAACRGTIYVFNTSCDIGPSNVVDSSQTQRGESSEPTKWTKGKITNSKGVESPLNMSKKVDGKPSLRKVAANQCPWVLKVSKLQDSETWQVKTFDDTHKCLQSMKIKYCTADFLSDDIIDQIETNPEILLRDYVMELQQSNPNITVRIEVKSKADHMNPTRVFKRIYVCLGETKEGFKASVGVNPNNGIYPLAYRIVEIESRESWTWFLQHLKEDLDLQDNSNFTFIMSDI
nr:hypothetical protein [Tanacetum cinerariifolium]